MPDWKRLVQRVSAEFFAVLRVAPLIGRPFRASDEVHGEMASF